MVDETCLPSNAYFPWTPDYTPFSLGPCLSVCLNILNFAFVNIDFYIYNFLNYDFGMLTLDSFRIFSGL